MKAKKIIIAVLFLGGGYFLIKKLLPTFNSSELDVEIKDYEVKQSIINTGGGGNPTANLNQYGTNNGSVRNVLTQKGTLSTSNNRNRDYDTPRTGKQNSMYNAPL
tara:strand:- start:145 stop:459 length:315 start_codon:yes stop_codon:yes gene_type:complete